jgi:hypothetical protein
VSDMVNHPPHYTRGPEVEGAVMDGGGNLIPYRHVIECIAVTRRIRDFRLATAMKYIWRVGFGGKEDDREDIQKAVWYLRDWLEHE